MDSFAYTVCCLLNFSMDKMQNKAYINWKGND